MKSGEQIGSDEVDEPYEVAGPKDLNLLWAVATRYSDAERTTLGAQGLSGACGRAWWAKTVRSRRFEFWRPKNDW
jgi:hypothetical protein